MEPIEQKYCVVATDRDTNKRKSITGSMSKDKAEQECSDMQKGNRYKRYYKYFKVAKYPYKTK